MQARTRFPGKLWQKKAFGFIAPTYQAGIMDFMLRVTGIGGLRGNENAASQPRRSLPSAKYWCFDLLTQKDKIINDWSKAKHTEKKMHVFLPC